MPSSSVLGNTSRFRSFLFGLAIVIVFVSVVVPCFLVFHLDENHLLKEAGLVDASSSFFGMSMTNPEYFDVDSRHRRLTRPFRMLQGRPGDSERRATYDPAKYPLFPLPLSDRNHQKLKVRLLAPGNRKTGKYRHIFLEGLDRSDYIDLVAVTDLPSNESYIDLGEELWVDAAFFSGTCQITIDYAKKRNKPIKVLMLDYQDYPKITYCGDEYADAVGGKDNLRYVKRSLTDGRQWNYTAAWIDVGQVVENLGTTFTGSPIIHGTYTVRTDQLLSIRARFDGPSPMDHGTRWDAIHVWGKSVEGLSHLRNRITEVMREMNGQNLTEDGSRQLKVSANFIGERSRQGRNTVQTAYIGMMLKAKIVVVTQRDRWEDHYRLTEAMNCGAMVLHDEFLGLPFGFEDGEHLVMFNSEQDFREKLVYYVTHDEERERIARNGWELVMGRHRSWHRMEQLIFGQPLTDVDDPYGSYNRTPRS